MAQSAEHPPSKGKVIGSIPIEGTFFYRNSNMILYFFSLFIYLFVLFFYFILFYFFFIFDFTLAFFLEKVIIEIKIENANLTS